jgi:hypothetical protein
MIRYFLLFICLQLIVSAFGQGKLEFFGEKIDFTIDKERFSTNGIYFFANTSGKDIVFPIFFPFAKNADSITVRQVFNISYSQNIDYQFKQNGILFSLSVLANDTVYVNIAYSQLTTKENMYILSSTQAWKKPLKQADYTLKTDDSISILEFSYPPDRQSGNIYYWNKTDFYPEKEFSIKIE